MFYDSAEEFSTTWVIESDLIGIVHLPLDLMPLDLSHRPGGGNIQYMEMLWQENPHHWPFVRGIHRSPMDSPHKGPVMRSFDHTFVVGLKRRPIATSLQWKINSFVMFKEHDQPRVDLDGVSYSSFVLTKFCFAIIFKHRWHSRNRGYHIVTPYWRRILHFYKSSCIPAKY